VAFELVEFLACLAEPVPPPNPPDGKNTTHATCQALKRVLAPPASIPETRREERLNFPYPANVMRTRNLHDMLRAIGLRMVATAAMLAFVPMSAPAAEPAPQQFYDLGTLRLGSGKSIAGCRIGFRTMGNLNAARSNVIVFPTFFSGASDDVLGWLQGPNALFDPSRYFVIAVDALGNGISCSPSNSRLQPGASFPWFSIDDMAEAEHRLLVEHFRLTHVHAVIGLSMGGMQTFSWMVRYPDFADVAIPIVGSPQLASYDILLWNAIDRAIIDAPGYDRGAYRQPPPIVAAQLMSDLHVYTPAHWVEHTSRTEVLRELTTSPLRHGFDANDWRWQIHAMLQQDVAAGSTLAEAAGRVHARTLVINARQDLMVNPQPAQEFAHLLHARFILLQGDCGHIAPLCEAAKIRPEIEAMLAQHRG
jgi:homoserine O-acetyltransferase